MPTLNAYAKVNLHLHVGPRRKDGYHNIETIFQEISVHDTLRFQVTPGPLEMTVSPSGLPTGSDNLVMCALTLLREKLKIKKGMRVHLEKNIPIGAGLGGGSSDAAAALWMGWQLWKKGGGKPNRKRIPPVLLACAKKLGADVTFFLRGGIAWGTGIGERLEPVAGCKKRWMVLIYPNVHVSTRDAYAMLDEFRSANRGMARQFDPPPKEQVIRYMRGIERPGLMFPNGPHNSFQTVILSRFPEVADARQELIRLGCAPIMMSGSGSTMFGFVKDEAEGRAVVHELSTRPWQVFLAHTLH